MAKVIDLQAAKADHAFYLIVRDGEYRVTGFISQTRIDNHRRTGWDVVKRYKVQPSQEKVTQDAYVDSWNREEE